ncbi:hypothetical protein GDO81_007026 [Engystomops pustulosus]|uniref:Uncharacterized protein n=1 Tax=Engystomops pustulosus TaxID=76066 RepID=A0AAV7D0Z0_ENGPU|nr:hypothetical protein GDO81_007026 [Engystomops pustulosus]
MWPCPTFLLTLVTQREDFTKNCFGFKPPKCQVYPENTRLCQSVRKRESCRVNIRGQMSKISEQIFLCLASQTCFPEDILKI